MTRNVIFSFSCFSENKHVNGCNEKKCEGNKTLTGKEAWTSYIGDLSTSDWVCLSESRWTTDTACGLLPWKQRKITIKHVKYQEL